MAGQITRTFTTAKAWAWVVRGKNEDGSPKMDKVGFVDFVSTKPTINDAFKALKNAGIRAQKSFCGFDVLEEVVYAMDIDTFMEHAVKVTRLPNGRVSGVVE